MSNLFEKEIFKLGFGMMRLPKNADGSIDVPQTAQMVDEFLAAGGTYIDTAFVYPGSEEAVRQALVERHPRESYTLATKLNAWMQCHDEESAKQQFYTSLERTGAGYFDFYLLHALMRSNYDKYEEYHIWDFVKELKEKGLIRHYGFSFHADPDFLEQILTEHPDVKFVQLQLNYADWENPGTASQQIWEIARRHGKPIIVMEPLKGGALADPVPPVRKVLLDADPDAPIVSWGIRFAAGLEGVHAVLSGMSSLEQMKENLSYMKDFKPLDEAEMKVIRKAQDALNADLSIPCTACHYCTDGCPMNIPIPEIIAVANRQHKNEDFRQKREYLIATTGKGKASDCIQCGQCENACPQHLSIISYLEECAKYFEQ